MGCKEDISKDIISTCVTQGVGGNEIKAWIGQRADFDFTYDATNTSKVTGIAAAAGKQLYTATTSLKGINSGFDRVVALGLADRFTHFVALTIMEYDTLSVENVDSIEDVFVVVESKDKTDDGDGIFRGFGLKYGLKIVTDNMRANEANGGRPIELGPVEGDSEPWSQYNILDTDYATTKALLEGLETVV